MTSSSLASIENYLASEFGNDNELRPVAEKILRIFVSTNTYSEETTLNKSDADAIRELFLAQEKPDLFIAAILKLLVSEDMRLSLLAGATCCLIDICPSSPTEALCLKRALDFYKTLPSVSGVLSRERVTEIVKLLTHDTESSLSHQITKL